MTANGMPPDDSADKSLGEIVAEVSEKASQLVREEIELAKAEVKDKVSKLTRGAVIAGAASVFAVFGITTFFHGLAWFLNDVFNWEDNNWAGFAVVTGLLFLLAILAALIAFRLFKKGAPPTPSLAIQEAKATRAELEAQKIERDQVKRSLGNGEHAVRASDRNPEGQEVEA
ncbi:MAG TPA: phage holin family protein [Thermoleophilaceae bacterium]|nr:phage holin family protein [Thermoleophilaceae bacterium]